MRTQKILSYQEGGRVSECKITEGVKELLAWSKGEITLTMWLPDGTKADLTFDEWAALRSQEKPSPTTPNPNRSE